MPGKPPTAERLRATNEKLRGRLVVEQAAAVASRFNLPGHFAPLLASLPPEEQQTRAVEIARELGERTGHPAGSPEPLDDQEGGDSPAAGAGGVPSHVEEEDRDLPPDRLQELAAITRAGSEGGQPVDRFETAKGRLSEAIAATKSWTELEQLQAGLKRR